MPPETQPAVGSYDALELFEQSVRRARPEIQLGEQDRAAAIRICNLVEGLPLAIELAAAWINVLSCEEIAREIEKSFDFLKTSQRDMPERHKSLRAVFDHSWQLLTDEERLALSRLSIFQGGFSREAAEAVAGASLDTLSSLLAKSLIRRAEDGRFDLHEAVRQYAATHLKDERALQEAHARYYISLLGGLESALQGADLNRAVQTLTHDFSNIHVAWLWGAQNKLYPLLNEVLLAAWAGYDVRGRTREGYLATDVLIEALRREPVTTDTQIWLGRALAYHTMFCYRSGDYPRGKVSIDESLTLLRSVNMPQLMIEPLLYSAVIYGLTGNAAVAQANVDEGVALARQYNQRWFIAAGTFNQGANSKLRGDLPRANQLLKEALTILREMGNPARMMGLALNYLSAIAIELDWREEARNYLNESLKLSSATTDRWGLGAAWRGLGALALREGDTLAAENYLRQSLAVFTELGARGDLAESLTLLGKLHLFRSEFDEAREALKKAIRLGLESNTMPQVYEAAVELADCLLNLGRFEDASALLRALPDSAFRVESARRRVEQVRGEVEAQVSIEMREEIRQGVKRGELESELGKILGG
ncbi:tetratricopeptide repeat protein [Chloroflexi bacterium CFX2]|nr:tetratricopeptide repeat protein [Chloroflexi bacterium CFX2]